MTKTSLPKKDWPGRFDESHYALLIKCSDKKDFSEWDEFRRKLSSDVLLTGAILKRTYLQKADLHQAILCGADFNGADLKGAILWEARLEKVSLMSANLERAELCWADLSSASLWFVNLSGADFFSAIVDGRTQIFNCITDDKTDFTGVGLGEARIDPQLKSTLEANIRRRWWINNYKSMHPVKRYFSKFFWWLSDYGRSTMKIMKAFGISAFSFAVIYALHPGIIAELIPKEGESVNLFLRSLYFSVVTMTTLGFGDMHAAQGSIAGHILLMVHVIIGYVILAALIVRIGTLFTSVPPEHKEAPPEKKEK